VDRAKCKRKMSKGLEESRRGKTKKEEDVKIYLKKMIPLREYESETHGSHKQRESNYPSTAQTCKGGGGGN